MKNAPPAAAVAAVTAAASAPATSSSGWIDHRHGVLLCSIPLALWVRSRFSARVTPRSTPNRDHMVDSSASTVAETKQQRFERILSREPFKGLKTILDSLCRDRQAVWDGVNGTNSYEDLVVKLGYRVTLDRKSKRLN